MPLVYVVLALLVVPLLLFTALKLAVPVVLLMVAYMAFGKFEAKFWSPAQMLLLTDLQGRRVAKLQWAAVTLLRLRGRTAAGGVLTGRGFELIGPDGREALGVATEALERLQKGEELTEFSLTPVLRSFSCCLLALVLCLLLLFSRHLSLFTALLALLAARGLSEPLGFRAFVFWLDVSLGGLSVRGTRKTAEGVMVLLEGLPFEEEDRA